MNIFTNLGQGIGNMFGGGTPAPQVQQAPTYTVRGHTLTDDDLKILRNTLFAEISNRTPDKQQLEGHTIINTALNRMDQYKAHGTPKSLSQVLTMPNQYQGYGSPEYQRLVSGKTTPLDSQKLTAIDSVLGKVRSGTISDNTGGSVFYHHDSQGKIYYKPGPLFAPTQRTIKNLTQ